MSEDRQSKWPEIIDKLTDPLEVAITKIFSAQFLMATITTMAACAITWYVCAKHPDKMEMVLPVFFSTWGIIVTHYFRRDRQTEEKK